MIVNTHMCLLDTQLVPLIPGDMPELDAVLDMITKRFDGKYLDMPVVLMP